MMREYQSTPGEFALFIKLYEQKPDWRSEIEAYLDDERNTDTRVAQAAFRRFNEWMVENIDPHSGLATALIDFLAGRRR